MKALQLLEEVNFVLCANTVLIHSLLLAYLIYTQKFSRALDELAYINTFYYFLKF